MIDAKTKKQLETLRDEIAKLNTKINAKEVEIHNLISGSITDFEGSFVRFYDGTNIVFMNVERQIIRDNGSTVVLVGPSITLNDDPLCFHDDYDGIDFGTYKEDDEIEFNAEILEGEQVETIDVINKYDMTFVVDYYLRTIKENVLRGIYSKD